MLETDDSYWRDRRKWDLAWRLLKHGARPRTITRWTGFSAGRLRRFLMRYPPDAGTPAPRRRRGKAPYRIELLLRSRRKRTEGLVFAQICLKCSEDVESRIRPAQVPDIPRGERLCTAFEAFQEHHPSSTLTIEEAILFEKVLTEGGEFAFELCTGCRTLALGNRWLLGPRVCEGCGGHDLVLPMQVPGRTFPPKRNVV